MRLALVLSLVLVPLAWAGDLEVVGERVIPANRFADFTVKGKDKNLDWFVYPIPEQMVERGGGLSFSGRPNTAYVLKVTYIDFAGQKTLKSDLIPVTFGVAPPVPPKPDPDPVPPAPEDEFTKGLRAALAATPAAEKEFVRKLASVYGAMADALDKKSVTKWSKLNELMVSEAKSSGVAGKLSGLQDYLLSTSLKGLFPAEIPAVDSPEDSITEGQRLSSKSALETTAAALKALTPANKR